MPFNQFSHLDGSDIYPNKPGHVIDLHWLLYAHKHQILGFSHQKPVYIALPDSTLAHKT